MKPASALTLIGLVAFSSPVLAEEGAQHRHPQNINQRQHQQDQRIKQGVRSGQLTKEEAQQLKQERRAIKQEEKADRVDGKLNKAERMDLQQDLNQMSQDIYREKHDGDVRPNPAK